MNLIARWLNRRKWIRAYRADLKHSVLSPMQRAELERRLAALLGKEDTP
jgi:hypothetical protein